MATDLVSPSIDCPSPTNVAPIYSIATLGNTLIIDKPIPQTKTPILNLKINRFSDSKPIINDINKDAIPKHDVASPYTPTPSFNILEINNGNATRQRPVLINMQANWMIMINGISLDCFKNSKFQKNLLLSVYQSCCYLYILKVH